MYEVTCKLDFPQVLGFLLLKTCLPWRRYGYSVDQQNLDNFVIYNIYISQPLHLHHLPQYSLCQLLQGAEALQSCHSTTQAVPPFLLYLGGP